MKLSLRILFATLLPFLGIIGAYHFLGTKAFDRHLSENYRQLADNRLMQAEIDINDFFYANQVQLGRLAILTPPDQNRPIVSENIMRGLLQNEESFFSLAAINAEGRVWLQVDKFHVPDVAAELQNLFNDPIFQTPMAEGAPFLGRIFRLQEFPLPFIDISVPVKDKSSGSVSGIIWAQLSFQGIQAILERYIPQQGKLILLSQTTGDILVTADDTQMDFSVFNDEVFNEILKKQAKKGWLGKNGKSGEVNFVFRKFSVSNHDFLLLYYQPNETIFFLANRLKVYTLYAFLAGTVLFAFASFLLIRKIINPLAVLTKKISDLSQRYRAESIHPQSEKEIITGDEVTLLSMAFGSFQEQLAIYSKEIEDFHQTLERQVADKTRKLEALNRSQEDLIESRTLDLTNTNKALLNEIDERLKAQEAVAAEKEQLAVTLRSIGDGVITTDTASNIVLLNTIAEDLTGWTNEEAIGKSVSDIFLIFNGKTGEACHNPVEEVLKTGSIVGHEKHTVLRARDGSEKFIADSGAPIRDKDGEIVGVVLVFRDVTEKNRMEEELFKARKLESVGVLAGGIAHDFNNILVAILGNISLTRLAMLKEGMDDHLLEEAEKASLRARDLTQQLLTFSKGGGPVRRLASIKEIITDNADFVLRGSNVRCEYSFAEDLWPLEIDIGQISQVIQNIVINANQAMPLGGVISIRCRNVSRDKTRKAPFPLQESDYVEIIIEDKGVGIPAGLLDKIFDPYFSTKSEGSGLGLAVTHSIVSKHGGYITVDSKSEEGTTFTIYLPAARERQIDRSDEAPTQLCAYPCRILVMDDEEPVRGVVEDMLREMGHQVLLAKDGNEAIAMYQVSLEKAESIDMIIMDLTVPGGMGGEEAVKEILQLNPDAKVVVSSGYFNNPVMENYRDYGFCAAIIKPFIFQDLVKIIGELL